MDSIEIGWTAITLWTAILMFWSVVLYLLTLKHQKRRTRFYRDQYRWLARVEREQRSKLN